MFALFSISVGGSVNHRAIASAVTTKAMAITKKIGPSSSKTIRSATTVLVLSS